MVVWVGVVGSECLRGGGGGATGRGHLAGERGKRTAREGSHGDIRLSKELAKTGKKNYVNYFICTVCF